jgi:hypothetical protein
MDRHHFLRYGGRRFSVDEFVEAAFDFAQAGEASTSTRIECARGPGGSGILPVSGQGTA